MLSAPDRSLKIYPDSGESGDGSGTGKNPQGYADGRFPGGRRKRKILADAQIKRGFDFKTSRISADYNIAIAKKFLDKRV